MKKIIYKVFALLLGLIMILSCESMDETNTDPTRMDEANAGSFLAPVIYNMSVYTWQRYNSYTFQLMQCLVTTNSTNGVGWYRITDTAGDGAWTQYYKWLTNAKAIYDNGVAVGDANYQAIGLTLQCWMYETLTDAFGDIPVKEACRGDEQLYYPKFDSQKDVYSIIIDSLDAANRRFEPSKGLKYNDGGDMLYCTSGTDADGITKWRKFANSLRMRALLRVIDVPGLDAAAKLKQMIDNPDDYPVFENNDESAMTFISGVAPYEAPMTRPSDLSSYKQLSEFFINPLKEWNDPRLPIFAVKATNKDENGKDVKDYVGLQSGYADMPTINGSAPNATTLATAPQSIALMTYSEVLFIKAELAQRGIIQQDAAVLYEAAVEANMQQWGVELPAGYFDNPKTAYDGTLKRIMEQKFYALFFIDFQQWFEYNRTGYPDVPTGPGVATGDAMPYRYKYPAILQRMNRENYLKAVESMGSDDITTKLIWQKR